MRKLVIFGARAFAEVAHHYFTREGGRSVAAFTVDGSYLEAPSFRGLPVVPFEEIEQRFPASEHEVFVAIGYHGMNRERADRMAAVEAKGYRLASFVSARADTPPDFVVEPNVMIMERAFLQPFVEVGRGSILWSTTRVGFRTRIGAFCWVVCPIFGESVELGDYSFVGLNATIGPGIKIGKANVIGAGSLVLRSTADGEVWRATHAKRSSVPSTDLDF
jgi:sugar O-acyltransferase (sialic acid O-acetyltransferase NeuD family)